MKSISFIGGDKRNLLLSKMYEKEKKVYTYGLDGSNSSFYECINNSEYIVTAIPFSTDNEFIYTPLSNEKITIEDFINNTLNKTILGGKIKKEHVNKLMRNGNKVIDIMQNEEFILKNTIPTAEGVIKLIIENTDCTIDENNIAVLGFGRVGKKVASILKALNATVYCYDINKEEVANIELYGYNVLDNIDRSLSNMSVIVNTVPSQIIKEEQFKYINKSTFILDVASNPGGVDLNHAKNNGYRAIQVLGIPGKIAPKTSAKYMKDILNKIII